MKKKSICALPTGAIAATCAAPASACMPAIKTDMSWKEDLARPIVNIEPSDITIPSIVIPNSYFKNIKVK